MIILKIFWWLVQILFLAAVALWLYFTLSGDVNLSWGDYNIKTNAGVAASSLFIVTIFIIFFSHLVGDLVRLPADIARKLKDNKRAKGHQALMRALSATSTGDFKNAYYLANRAKKYLPESEQGLSLLLQAHAAKLQGNDQQAHNAFELLTKNADTSVLGVQGLLQKRVLNGDLRGALELARAQAKQYPKNIHLVRPVYDLERRNRLWNDALISLQQLQKYNVINKAEAMLDRAVLWIILGDMAAAAGQDDQALKCYAKAYHADPKFAPSVTRLSRLHNKKGQRFRAVNIAKRAIEKQFHPSFVNLWVDLKPAQTDPAKDLKWMTWLIDHAPESSDAYCALARIAIDLSLWGEAKSALMKAEKIEPTKNVYRLWVLLEEKNNAPAATIRQWLDRLEQAPLASSWVCQKTFKSFDDYVPLVEPENLFNSLLWGKAPAPLEKQSAALLSSPFHFDDERH